MAENELQPNIPPVVKEESHADEIGRVLDEALASVEGSSTTEAHVKSENADDEEIDPHFFDEILQRAEQEKLAATEADASRLKQENNGLEEGELSDNEGNNEANKKKDNNSKSSKESETSENNRPRIQVRSDLCVPSTSIQKPKLPIPSPANKVPAAINSESSQSQNIVEKVARVLTPQEKLCKALENIVYAKRALEKASQQKEIKFYPNNPVFAYTPTIRKLPSNRSHFMQQIYDNRSPLHTVNNVSFEFNSITTHLNLREWGLEALPTRARQIARTLGYDVNTLCAKLKNVKIPDKIKKSAAIDTIKLEEACEQTNSTLFMNAMVQTDEVRIIPARRSEFYSDVGTQCVPPSANVVGTQTSGNYMGTNNEGSPLFQMIRNLNENQLQAVDDFIQLINEPVNSISMDLYLQKKRLYDIYKISQMPSEIPNGLKRSADTAGLSTPMPTPPPPPNLREFEYQTAMEMPMTQTSMRSNSRGAHFQPLRKEQGNFLSQNHHQKFFGRGGLRR